MIEIRRILCPCDFSVFSERARDHAIGLAQWYEAELSILHVVPHAAGVWAYPPSVTPSTLEPVPRDQVQAERLDARPIRGRTEPVVVYVLKGLAGG